MREEAICGLARRRDPRAVGLLARLLAAEDGAHVLVFGAAAVLGAEELLLLLEEFDSDEPGVQDALDECDPAARDRRDQFAWDLVCSLYRQLPGIDASVSGRRHQVGIEFRVGAGGHVLTWSADALRDRARGDPERAAALVAADLHGPTRT